MQLYLMRHGIADPREDPACPLDPERALTAGGRKRTRSAAAGLRALGVHPTRVLTSPYLRARQTAEIVADVLGLASAQIHSTAALLPGADPAALFAELADAAGDADVLCSGHAPHLDLALGLAVSSIGAVGSAEQELTRLKKAGVACLLMGSWQPPRGLISWVATPAMLRAVGGESG